MPISKPSIAFVGVITTFGVVNAFEESYLLYKTAGGPGHSGLILGTYLYREGFVDFRLGYASAVAYGMAFLLFAFALVQLRWSRNDDTGLQRRGPTYRLKQASSMTLLASLALALLIPLWWVVISSMRTPAEIYSSKQSLMPSRSPRRTSSSSSTRRSSCVRSGTARSSRWPSPPSVRCSPSPPGTPSRS